MQALTLAPATKRFSTWFMPFLLGIGLVACGGGGGSGVTSTANPTTGSAAALPTATSPTSSITGQAATQTTPAANTTPQVTTGAFLIAGNTGGGAASIDATGVDARFFYPAVIAANAAGNLYVADSQGTIRKITAAGVVTTVPGTTGISYNFGNSAVPPFDIPFAPASIAADAAGNVYRAGNGAIFKITPAGMVSTLAGTAGVRGSADGSGAAAQFFNPSGIAADAAGNLYVADSGSIRKITAAGAVTTLAGTANLAGNVDGSGANAQFNSPSGIAVDAAGNLYVVDPGNQNIRKITPAGVVTTLAGTTGVAFTGRTDGSGASRFGYPHYIAVDAAGNVYVTDTVGQIVRKITPTGVVTTLAGTRGVNGSADGSGAAARFNYPQGIALDMAGNLVVADTRNQIIRKITLAGEVTTLAGTAFATGSANGGGAAAQFNGPRGITADSAGNLYVADRGNGTIRKITPAGVVTTLAGTPGVFGSADGSGAAAQFFGMDGIAADTAGNLYVADSGVSNFTGGIGGTIRKISPSGVVTTLAGTPGVFGSADGSGAAAQFGRPSGIAVDTAGSLYVTDTNNDTIRKITAAGVVTTLAGTPGVTGHTDGSGAAAQFTRPNGTAVDMAGNLYVIDSSNAIRKITAGGVVTTLAGTPALSYSERGIGSVDGSGAAARFNYPQGIAVDAGGNLYVADTDNHTIRKITPAGVVTTVAGVAGQVGILLGSLPGSLSSPQGVALLANNTLAVTTANSVLKLMLP